jgi:hypothetical protein
VTVCDLAYEELGTLALVHWSVPDQCQPAIPEASTRRSPSWQGASSVSRPG